MAEAAQQAAIPIVLDPLRTSDARWEAGSRTDGRRSPQGRRRRRMPAASAIPTGLATKGKGLDDLGLLEAARVREAGAVGQRSRFAGPAAEEEDAAASTAADFRRSATREDPSDFVRTPPASAPASSSDRDPSFILVRQAPGGPFDEDRVAEGRSAALERGGTWIGRCRCRSRSTRRAGARRLGPSMNSSTSRSGNCRLFVSCLAALARWRSRGRCQSGCGSARRRRRGGAPTPRRRAARRGRAAVVRGRARAGHGRRFRLRLLPPGGWSTLPQAVLPALALGLPVCAVVARSRAATRENLAKDYCRTARAKGLTERAVR